MWQAPHSRHSQRTIRRRNHLGMFACLLIAVLVTGILIGRASREAEAPGQVFLNNAAPSTLSPPAHRAEPVEEETRAPLGTVVRRAPTARGQRSRPTPRASKTRRQNTIDGSHEEGPKTTVLTPDPGTADVDESGSASSIESEVVARTNAARRLAGCRPLRVDDRLSRSARAHSADMALSGRLSHSSADGGTPWERMERAGYPNGGAENIGRGYQSADEAVRGWMGSPSHRANIVNCRLRAIGVGVADGPGGPWWTQDFGYS